MLVALARIEGLVLLTQDRKLLPYGVPVLGVTWCWRTICKAARDNQNRGYNNVSQTYRRCGGDLSGGIRFDARVGRPHLRFGEGQGLPAVRGEHPPGGLLPPPHPPPSGPAPL